jgi:hypothetical protein
VKNKSLTLAMVLALAGCDEMVTTQSAEDALDMCHYAALEVIKGTGNISFPSSFHNPFRDPTVVRLRYFIENTEVSGTIRCYYEDDTDDRFFKRITVDDTDVADEILDGLSIYAKGAIKNDDN